MLLTPQIDALIIILLFLPNCVLYTLKEDI